MKSLPSVLKRCCLPLFGAGLLFACSSEDSGSAESGGTAAGGTDATISAGGTAESGGTTGSAGAIVELTGATSGGGVETGGGGTTTGGRGVETGGVGTGGDGNGTGGVETGGDGNGTGGDGVETGGDGVETGGVETGGGGVETGGGGSETSGAATGGSAGGTVVDHPLPPEDITEEVNGVSFDMVYVPGGTFTLGCESESCPVDTAPVSGVTVSAYYIGKNEVTTELWEAVTGESSGLSGSMTSISWYDAMDFACLLYEMTGKRYRLTTEAEWEYAAKNHLSSLEDIGGSEEWVYNSWSITHMGGTDPVGTASGAHTQKTRRDPRGTGDNITGRLIRALDSIGPALRLAISAEVDLPPGYVPPCNVAPPSTCPSCESVNSYRDPQWVTGSEAHWTKGLLGEGDIDLRVWEDGTATLNGAEGQWFTSNNIAFVFVSSLGELTKYPYIFLDETQGSVIPGQSSPSGGFVGRISKEAADSVEKPALSALKSGAELAAAAGDEYQMVDMENIPDSAKEQDVRLMDGPGQGWSQKNVGAQHHYRKDVDSDEFRFTVNQEGNQIMLANGTWFTVGNTFLRVTHSTGYICDYLYAITEDGVFYHDSFQGYERGDYRAFRKEANGPDFNNLCGDICSDEIPKGEGPPLLFDMENGQSTFVPASCPAGGCE